MKTLKMTEGKPLRLLLSVALPLMLGNVFQQMYTLVDAGVVGRGVGMDALAALGAADWYNWMFLSCIQGLTQGFTIPVAQRFGANDGDGLRKAVGRTLIPAAVTSVLITIIGLLAARPVLILLDTPESILPLSALYLRIILSALPVTMAYNLAAGILRALGDGKTPLYAMIVASFVNIGLDLLFVLSFGWGVPGAAAATVIAQVCSCIYCLLRLRKIEILRLHREHLRPDRTCELLKLGLPVSAQNVIIAIGGMIVQSVVNPLGVAFIAGYTACNKLYGLLEIAGVSYGYALTAYCGQNLGARKPHRIQSGVRTGIGLGVATALCIAAVMFGFGRQILGLFIDFRSPHAEEALRIAFEFLCVMSVGLPALYVLHACRAALLGLGNTFIPMVSGLVEFFMRTGSALILSKMIGYWGIFFAELLAWSGAAVLLVVGYRRCFRKTAVRLPESAS